MGTKREINEYLRDQDFAPRTKEAYKRDLEAFFVFSKGESPTVENVRAWRQSLEEKERSASHIGRCLYALKGYCEWQELDIFAKPRERSKHKIRAPGLQFRDPPETRSIEEINRMFKECKNPRDQMLLMLLVTTGARIGELMQINVKEDLDPKTTRIALTRKGKRGRRQWISVSEATMNDVQKYLKWRQTKNPMLLPFTYQDLRFSFLALAKRAKVEFPKHSLFHNLRHFFVLYHKDQGTDLGYISLAAGHTSRQVTDRIYGALSPERIKQELHPMPWEQRKKGDK